MALPLRIGRLWSRFTGNLLGFAIGASAASAFEPLFADLSAEVWARLPNRRLSPADLAMMVVQGIRSEGEAAGEARETGIDGKRFAELVRLSGEPPGFETVLELWRRGELTEERVERAVRQSRIKTEYLEALKALRRLLLDPATLAAMVAEGVLPAEEGAALARERGLDPGDFERLVRRSQAPPSPGQVLELLNRGELTEGEARTALRRAGLEPRYTDPLLELRNVLPSPSDLVRFAVREVFTPSIRERFGMDQDFPAEATPIGRRIGLDRETLELYWAAHWDLPSPEQGFRMFHRGVIDEATLRQLLRALDVMPFWRGRLIELAYNVPGRIDLRRMYQAGVIDRARLLRGYRDLGYEPGDAQILAEFAAQGKLADERDLTKAEVTALYQARSLSRSEAADMLRGLGYDPEEAGLLLDLADYRRERAYRTAAVGVVRARYRSRDISADEAATQLDRLGLVSGERDELLDLWTFERESDRRTLTEPQARAAWRRGLLSEGEYRERLSALGYREPDLSILAELGRPAEGA